MAVDTDTFITRELEPRIGTEIRTDAATLVSGRHAREIRALLEERGVLVFPGVGLDDEQQVAFTQTLGTQAYENNGYSDADGNKQLVYKVSLDPEVNPQGPYLRASFFWHLDGSMSDTPILASILGLRHLPAEGAATEWCNTYAAYDTLPDEDKAAIEHLRVVNSNWALQRYLTPEPSYEEFLHAKKGPSKEQPLVWKHQSGRRSLIVGCNAAYIADLEPTESWELLVRLRDWATQPQFVYHHDWSEGDLVMWDNTGTLHRALPYDPMGGRLLHRTMLQGEEPIV